MSVFKSNYWKMPVLAQKFMGVWPFERTFYDKCMPIFVYMCLYSLIIPIGIRLFQEVGVHSDIVIENLVGQMYLNAGVIKFSMTIIFTKQHKEIYELIARDWKMTIDKEEAKIMESHASIGRTISLTYLVCCCSTAGAFLSIPTFYPLLDFISPLENETRPLTMPYYAEYFIDQQANYYPLMAKAFVAGTISMVVFISYDMVFAMCVQHVCSLFDIINLRLERASKLSTEIATSKMSRATQSDVFDLVTQAINLHQIVIENVLSLENSYHLCWFFILLLNTTAIGGGFLIVLLKLDRPLDLLRYGMFVSTIFIHKYFIFLPGQKIINYSLKVFDASYACEWYHFSPKCKVLLRIIMLRSIRPMGLTGGKMFLLCMETYSAMLKAGMSYFTMFANTR